MDFLQNVLAEFALAFPRSYAQELRLTPVEMSKGFCVKNECG